MAAAWDETTPAEIKGYIVYAASKVEAERAAWKFVEAQKPGFVLNTIIPNFNVSYPASRLQDQTNFMGVYSPALSSILKSVARPWAGQETCSREMRFLHVFFLRVSLPQQHQCASP